MIQSVQYGLVTAGASVETQAGPCGICGGQSGAGTFLTRVFRLSPVSTIPSVLLAHSSVTDPF